ncbi:MAG: hypothetical protein WCC66_13790 [Rhizobiaceae bacterium]
MNIVICNIQMSGRTGTEIVTRDLALGLKSRGHQVSVLTQQENGPVADELRAKGVPVVANPSEAGEADIIHINHMESATALLALTPDVPAIFVCHDATTGHSYAKTQPSIKSFFGVSEACRQRIAADTGLALDKIGVMPNYLNLGLIPLREARLPLFPRKWLFVAEKWQSEILLAKLETVAQQFKANLEVIGPWAGKTVDDLPAACLGQHLVFASARCAMEASATGAGVIVCDPRGLAGFLTPELWRKAGLHNLGYGCLAEPCEIDTLAGALRRWNPWKASKAGKIIRAERDLSVGLDRIESIYRSVIA